jgi:hypothetical protein
MAIAAMFIGLMMTFAAVQTRCFVSFIQLHVSIQVGHRKQCKYCKKSTCHQGSSSIKPSFGIHFSS